MDKFREMQTFVNVVDSGSFVQAAIKLNSSKPAISRLIADLEERLSARLLNRTTRRLSLTDEGHRFYDQAREILSAIEQAEEELSARSSKPSGVLRISAPLSFGVLELAPLLGQFSRENPDVQLDVELNDRTVDVVNEGFDLALRISRLASSSLISRQLAASQVKLCASPKYLKLRGVPKTIDELARHDAISYSYSPVRDEWNFEHVETKENKAIKITPRIRTNNGDSARILALNHHGFVLQPDFIIGNDLKIGTLIEVLPEYQAANLGVYAIYASRQHMPAKLRSMIDFLVASFKSPRWK